MYTKEYIEKLTDVVDELTKERPVFPIIRYGMPMDEIIILLKKEKSKNEKIIKEDFNNEYIKKLTNEVDKLTNKENEFIYKSFGIPKEWLKPLTIKESEKMFKEFCCKCK